MKTFKIRVIKSSREFYWYSHFVGKEYVVTKSHSSEFDYAFVDGWLPNGINGIPGEQPLFLKRDCLIIDEVLPKKWLNKHEFSVY